jgi:FAD/FMN-containing dehydrogenase
VPQSQSKKRDRDRILQQRWDERPPTNLASMGISAEVLGDAQRRLQGHIVLPGDPTYDTDRMLSNPAFNPSPLMIVFCVCEADVRVALELALHTRAPFTVRSGGHCTAGFSAGFGVLIDVRGLDGVAISTAEMRAVVGAGCNFGKLDQELALYGVHVPAGECPDVCVGGFVQGGGLGITSNTFGMNCDNVIEMRVMLADGSIVVASATVNRDLWWAMRGGTGGNFGVLLSVTYQLYELGDVTAFALAWEMDGDEGIDRAVDAMMLVQEQFVDSDLLRHGLNLQVQMVWQTLVQPGQTDPYAEPVCVFMVRGLIVGDDLAVDDVIAPLVALPGAIVQWKTTGAYNDVQDTFLNSPQEQPVITTEMGMPNEDKASRYVAQTLKRDEWRQLLGYFVDETPNTLSYMYLEVYGGAIATRSTAENAFVHRDAWYNAVIDVFWYRPDDRAASEQFLGGWIRRLEEVWNERVYQNYVNIDVPDYVWNYWGEVAPTLVAVKNKYDPDQRFTFAQQVPTDLVEWSHPTWDVPGDLAASLAAPIDFSGGAPLPGAG